MYVYRSLIVDQVITITDVVTKDYFNITSLNLVNYNMQNLIDKIILLV